MKKFVLCAAALTMLFGFTFATGAMAQDKGPATMTLKTTKGKKPAVFPHAKHQAAMPCDDCHKALDAKKMATDKNYAHKEGCKKCHKAKKVSTKCKTCHSASKKKAIEGC